jgi:tetratricopeptide (TPR) repeat protein
MNVRTPASCLLALAILVSGVSAQAMQLAPEQKQEMREHYEKAQRAYDIQKFAEAVDEYQKAYEIGGDPGMLFNIAQAHRLNDKPTEAIYFYRRYLERSPNAVNRDDVESKIVALEKLEEERRRVASAAPPALPPPAPVVVAPPAPVVPPPASAPATDPKVVASIAFLSIGAIALVTSAITGKLASSKADNLTTAAMSRGTFDPNVEKDGKAYNAMAIGSLVVGLTSAAVGGGLYYWSRKSSNETAHAALTPMLGSGTVGATFGLGF